MKTVIAIIISFVSIIIFCYSQTKEINSINKNHSNKNRQIEILDQSIKNLKSDKSHSTNYHIENIVVNLAEVSAENIILNEAIANIFRDEELKKLICCGSTMQNQLSKDKILVENKIYLDKRIN